MAKCEILLTTSEGQEVVGAVILGPTGMLATAVKGNEALMKEVMADSHEVDGEEILPDENMQAWFDSLPRHYNGSYLRARMVGK